MTHVQKRQDTIRDLIWSIRGDTVPEVEKLVLRLDKQALQINTQVYNEQVLTKYEGLIEKFDILGRSDISKELQPRFKKIIKASEKDFQCLEMLKLLSILSRNPLDVQSSLKEEMKEQLKNDEIDLEELFDDVPYDEPDYNDTLSDWSDVTELSEPVTESLKTVPRSSSPKKAQSVKADHSADHAVIMENINHSVYWTHVERIVLAESDVLRECLLSSQGISCYLFDILESGKVIVNDEASNNSNFAHLSHTAFLDIISKFSEVATIAVEFRQLSQTYYMKKKCSAFNYRFACGLLQKMVDELDKQLVDEEYSLLNDATAIVSLTEAYYKLDSLMKPYRQFIHLFDAVFIRLETEKTTAVVALLDTLLEHIITTELNEDSDLSFLLQKFFVCIFNHYIYQQGLFDWLYYGEVPLEKAKASQSFILTFDTNCPRTKLWSDWCMPNDRAIPVFLKDHLTDIMTVGKTSRFLQMAKTKDPYKSLSLFEITDDIFYQNLQSYCRNLIKQIGESNISLVQEFLLPDVERMLNGLRDVFFMLDGIIATSDLTDGFAYDDIIYFSMHNDERVPQWFNLSTVMDNILDDDSRTRCEQVHLLLSRLRNIHNIILDSNPRDLNLFNFISMFRNHIYQIVIQGTRAPFVSDKLQQTISDIRDYIATTHRKCFLNNTSLLDVLEIGHADESLMIKISELTTSYASQNPTEPAFQHIIH